MKNLFSVFLVAATCFSLYFLNYSSVDDSSNEIKAENAEQELSESFQEQSEADSELPGTSIVEASANSNTILQEEILRTPEKQAVYPYNPSAFYKRIKNVNPPVKGIEAPYETKILNLEDLAVDQTLVFNNGASLSIPANSLTVGNGGEIKESIQLAYMQIDNPFDGFLSGIPMKYDSLKTSTQFQTAGMFRLEAKTLSGEEVLLKKGKKMELAMPTIDTTDDYNFYSFNEKNGEWLFDGIAPTARDYSNITNAAFNQIGFDTTRFDEKFTDSKYSYLFHKTQDLGTYFTASRGHSRNHKKCQSSGRYMPFKNKDLKLFRFSAYSSMVDMDGSNEKERQVYFRLIISEKYKDYFTELRPFAYYTFMAKDIKKTSDFYKNYSRQKRYNDIRIYFDEEAMELQLILKHQAGFDTLIADVTKGGNRIQLFKNKRDMQRRITRYNRNINNRKECHNFQLERKISSFVQNFARGFSSQASSISIRKISLLGFGIYNCDRRYRMEEPIRYASRQFTYQDSLLSGYTVNVLDTVARGSFASNSSNFTLCAQNTMALLMIDLKGDIYYSSGKKMVAQRKNRQIKMNKLEAIPDSYEDFKAVFR